MHEGSRMFIAHFKKNMFHGHFIEIRTDGNFFDGYLIENRLDGAITKISCEGDTVIKEYDNGTVIEQ